MQDVFSRVMDWLAGTGGSAVQSGHRSSDQDPAESEEFLRQTEGPDARLAQCLYNRPGMSQVKTLKFVVQFIGSFFSNAVYFQLRGWNLSLKEQ